MAYSNWGAKVWCDDEARHENCDVTPEQILSGERYIHYLQHYMQNPENTTGIYQMFHAVVGDAESGVLVCLYKANPGPVFVVNGESLSELKYKSEDFDWWDELKLTFTTPDNKVEVELEGWDDLARIFCNFTDAKGRKWKAISGYGMGEGYEDWK